MSRCKSCSAPVRWVKTINGKNMPLDADPGGRPLRQPDGQGNVVLHGEQAQVLSGPGLLEADADPDVVLYRSHFSSCPNADQHRRR